MGLAPKSDPKGSTARRGCCCRGWEGAGKKGTGCGNWGQSWGEGLKMATEARGEGFLSPERAQNPTSGARIPALPAGGEGRWRRTPTRAHRLPWARGHGARFPSLLLLFLLTHLARPGRRSRDKAGPPAPCKPRRAPGAGAAAAASMRGARRPAAPPPSCASPALPARPRCRPRGKGRRGGGKGREAAVACRCSAFGSGAERPSEPRGRLLLLLLLPPPSFPPPPPALGSNRLLPARGRPRCRQVGKWGRWERLVWCYLFIY